MVFMASSTAAPSTSQDLFAHPRRPGREEDAHDLFEQITAIADELDDNLDDYAPRHQDIRKALPKLIQATERWSSDLKTPPDNEAYNVSRKSPSKPSATSTTPPQSSSKTKRPGSPPTLPPKKTRRHPPQN